MPAKNIFFYTLLPLVFWGLIVWTEFKTLPVLQAQFKYMCIQIVYHFNAAVANFDANTILLNSAIQYTVCSSELSYSSQIPATLDCTNWSLVNSVETFQLLWVIRQGTN